MYDVDASNSFGYSGRYLLRDFNGVVKSGEMMLVVGRPGSGTTTFLKTLASLTKGYAGVDGEILYGSMRTVPLLVFVDCVPGRCDSLAIA